jgi:ABC-type metal ion transport system substrate-binding protein
MNVVVDLTTLQKWQYLDNQCLQEDNVSMCWFFQTVRQPVTNYSAKVIADQTFS